MKLHWLALSLSCFFGSPTLAFDGGGGPSKCPTCGLLSSGVLDGSGVAVFESGELLAGHPYIISVLSIGGSITLSLDGEVDGLDCWAEGEVAHCAFVSFDGSAVEATLSGEKGTGYELYLEED